MYDLRNRGQLDFEVEDEFEHLVKRLRGWGLAEHDEAGNHRIGGVSVGFVQVGTIVEYAGITEPTDWFFCDGEALSRLERRPLFDVINIIYGDGDGSTTFNVPDLTPFPSLNLIIYAGPKQT